MKEQKELPNCHLFATEKSTFVYDLGSNELLEAEPELAGVLPLVGTGSESSIVDNLKNDFYVSKIKKACAIITSAQLEKRLFLAQQPLLEPSNPRLAQPGVL